MFQPLVQTSVILSIIKSIKAEIHHLREIFHADLSRKLTVGITSQDFEALLTLQLQNRRAWQLWLQQHVQELDSSHKVNRNDTRKAHMGKTQQKFKLRTQQHFGEVQKLLAVKFGKKSDARTKHFATQFYDAIPSPTNQRERIPCSIAWQGNPISVVKTFAAKNCNLQCLC